MKNLNEFSIKNYIKKYICSFCGFRTHKKYNLDRHKTAKHKNEASKASYKGSNSLENLLLAHIQKIENMMNVLQDEEKIRNIITEVKQAFTERSRLDKVDKSNANVDEFSENSQYIANKLINIITIRKSFEKIVKLRKEYIKTLDKIDDEVEREEKRIIFNKHVKEDWGNIIKCI